MARQDDLFFAPKDRFFEFNRQIVAQIRPALRPPASRPRPHPSKNVKDILKAKVSETSTKAAEPGLRACMTKLIIGGSLVGIGQDLVGLVDLFEPGLGLRVLVDVGMVLPGQPSKGSFDLVLGGTSIHAQYFIVVALGAHAFATFYLGFGAGRLTRTAGTESRTSNPYASLNSPSTISSSSSGGCPGSSPPGGGASGCWYMAAPTFCSDSESSCTVVCR